MNIFLISIIIAISVPIILYVMKQWFRGGVCKLKKDLSGKIVVITGSNTGIGYETALELAKQNATIILAGRDIIKNNFALQNIIQISNNKNIHYIQLDLSSFQSIRAFAKDFKVKFKKLDILINNAGLNTFKKSQTRDGIDITIGTNHYGHFLLTNLLLDTIQSTDQSRVINVASMVHYQIKSRDQFSIATLKNNNDVEYFAYSKSKLANILFTKELQRRLDSNKVKVVSLHPGVVDSEFFNKLFSHNLILRIVNILMVPVVLLGFKTVREGAQTTLQCALEDFEKLQPGAYYTDCKVKKSSKLSYDEELQKELWDQSMEIVGLK